MAKKILIITESGDTTADKVSQWLDHFGADFDRINSDHIPLLLEAVVISQNNDTQLLFSYKGKRLNLMEIYNLIWFRRGSIFVKDFGNSEIKNAAFPDDELLNNSFSNYKQSEANTLIDFVYEQIEKKVRTINIPTGYEVNKLSTLAEAKNVGFLIPETIITSNKDVIKQKLEVDQYITKAIKDSFFCLTNNVFLTQGTEEATIEDLLKDESHFFFPSLFQKKIDRKCEIRVFFILGKTFAAAISFYDEMNQPVDIRSGINDYGEDRMVTSIKLPVDVEHKLLRLAKNLKLESGSADFMITNDYEFVFLEINPVGQLDFLSVLSNQFIEREIAKILIENAKEEIKYPEPS
ncbi:hypothetical protein SF1_18870 [Sphingobacterium faecium NBRC 15299]|uniref:MvdC/MvdD family ATP grasp protein n=1 Tax=Sphingobacterium faecium TaxID=34087 RepID=UPI000D3744E6|nr:hypothetical protein [Sphingobacterium faecium]PTX09473.1 hypothetical protein C8N37_106101 [Sphingobacterium faecium]GEM63905.1 hypothetical protein SF1_18870 [Sphingobacterium faecium NBRC 15299]